MKTDRTYSDCNPYRGNEYRIALITGDSASPFFVPRPLQNTKIAYNGMQFILKGYSPDECIPADADIIHYLADVPISSIERMVLGAYRNMLPAVWSLPACLSNEDDDPALIAAIFKKYYNEDDLIERLQTLNVANSCCYNIQSKQGNAFRDRIAELALRSSRLLFGSEYEYQLSPAKELCAAKFEAIHLAADFSKYANADCALFRNRYGLSDYVLCVDKFTVENNQIALAYALRLEDFPLVFITERPSGEYADIIEKIGAKNVIILDHSEMDEAMVASAVAGAKVSCQANLCAGISQNALNAAAAGTLCVLSESSAGREYFGDFAVYCDPANPRSIRNVALKAMGESASPERSNALKALVREKYSPELLLQQYARVYAEIIEKRKINNLPSFGSMRKIYVDLTCSSECDAIPNGVPRVEINYAKKIYEYYSDKVEFIRWDFSEKAFMHVSYSQLLDLSYIKRFKGKHEGRKNQQSNKVEFCPESALIMIGTTWFRQFSYLRGLCTVTRLFRLYLTTFIHDMLKSKFEFWYDASYATHTPNFIYIASVARYIVTSSASAARDIYDFSIANNISLPPIVRVRLGDNIGYNNDYVKLSLANILSVIGKSPFILFVSGFEFRKNHLLIYNIYRKLLNTYNSDKIPHLVCVGAYQGFNLYIDMMKKDPLVKNHIHIFHDIKDNELDWLYNNCMFTLYPSLYEGWGLPVPESVSHGKICIASNASSIPEVAPGFTDLLDPLDFPAWYKKIETYIFDDSLRKNRELQIKGYKPFTWAQSGDQLCHALKNQSYLPVEWDIMTVGLTVFFNLNTKDWTFLGKGWGKLEEDGVWSVEKRSSLIMRLRMQGRPLQLHIEVKGFVPPEGEDISAIARINGKSAQPLHIKGNFRQYKFIIPAEAARDGIFSDIYIEFEILNPKIPREYIKNSSDTRLLGIKLSSFSVHRISVAEEKTEAMIQNINSLIEDTDGELREMLFKRPDVMQHLSSRGADQSGICFLLWAWAHGSEEENILALKMPQIAMALRKLHMTPYSIHGQSGYSSLVNAIWSIRDDLQEIFPGTEDGQRAMVEWFNKHGINEYGLEEIVAAEKKDVIKG